MTATAVSAPGVVTAAQFAEVQARITAIQAKITSLSPNPPSAQAFAATLTSLTRTGAPISATVSGAAVVAEAKTYLGVPYVWGGNSRSGIDCSGLVQQTFASFGVQLPRVAADQAKMGTAVPSLAQARPGDLVTFGDPAYHIAIYLGDNKIIEAPEPGKKVQITDLYQTPTSIRRIAADPAAGSSGSASTRAAGAGAAGTGLSAGAGLSVTQLLAAGRSRAVAAFADKFAVAEAQFNLPAGLLSAVAQQESGGNTRAVSPAGAQGLMQLMPATAAGLGVTDSFDPNQAIPAAAKILAGNLSQFSGSLSLALAAYNAGAGAVSRYGGIPPYPETQNYVRSITAMMGAAG